MSKKLSWKPIRRGTVFCSSACGAGCTYLQYLSALKAAKDCSAMMKTKGWKIRVYENMGWYWELFHKSGLLTVAGGQLPYKQNPNSNFHAMLSCSGGGGCDPMFFDRKRFSDPNMAVSHRLNIARKSIARLQGLLCSIDKSSQS